MFFVLLIVVCLVVAAISHPLQRKSRKKGISADDNGWLLTETVMIVLACIFSFILFLSTGVAYYNQVRDSESLTMYDSLQVVYSKKAEVLTAEFVKDLAETYPQHERDVFEKIVPANVSVYVAKYPDLKASETIMALVTAINQLQNDVYDQDVKKQTAKRDIRLRVRNPWILASVIPEK